jgi:hypothetical protein
VRLDYDPIKDVLTAHDESGELVRGIQFSSDGVPKQSIQRDWDGQDVRVPYGPRTKGDPARRKVRAIVAADGRVYRGGGRGTYVGRRYKGKRVLFHPVAPDVSAVRTAGDGATVKVIMHGQDGSPDRAVRFGEDGRPIASFDGLGVREKAILIHERTVSPAGIVSVHGQRLYVGIQHAGREVSYDYDGQAETIHIISVADKEEIANFSRADIRRKMAQRPQGKRRVTGDGLFCFASRIFTLGNKHAKQTVNVSYDESADTLSVFDHKNVLITTFSEASRLTGPEKS